MRLRIRAKKDIPDRGYGYSLRTKDRSILHTVYTSYEESGQDYIDNEPNVYYFPRGYDNFWIKKEHCDIVGEPIIGGEIL